MFSQEVVDRACMAASEPMIYGRDDCCAWVRGAVLAAGGPDLMIGLPAYSTAAEAGLLIAREGRGCLLRMAFKIADRLDLRQARAPFTDGLVGVVLGERGPSLALRHNGAWLARAERGIAVMPDRLCAVAWEVF